MSRAEQPQKAPQPPAPRAGYLWTAGAAWARSGAAVRSFTFPADIGLNHELIDVNNPSQRVELVYPTLINLIEEAR